VAKKGLQQKNFTAEYILTDLPGMNNILHMQGQSAKQPVDFPNLLEVGEKPVVEIINPEGKAPLVLVCEHASNTIPDYFNGLGLSQKARQSHIAWDPGALPVALALSRAFDAPLVCARISRLVYDCNRPPSAPSAIPAKSEDAVIPGNANISQAEGRARIEQIYQPFNQTLEHTIARHLANGNKPALVTIHSFTPVFLGRQRLVELGILHSSDTTLADKMLSGAPQITELRVERNQPYGPADGVSHTLDIHGIANGLANVMIEIRNDLLTTPEAVESVAQTLQTMIEQALDIARIQNGRKDQACQE
jgi:predicted N-formylglutamate amidohydrolase